MCFLAIWKETSVFPYHFNLTGRNRLLIGCYLNFDKKYWHNDCCILGKEIPIWHAIWNFIVNVKRALKKWGCFFCRTEVWNRFNRLLICLNSIFSELKQFHLVHVKINILSFHNVCNFRCNIDKLTVIFIRYAAFLVSFGIFSQIHL